MNRTLRGLFGIGLVALLAACASGPKYEAVHATFPDIDPNSGRIFFYREAVFFGDGVQPDVKLNGQIVGSAQPDGFFFVDRPPGDYEVLTSTEVDERLTFTLREAQTRYVKLSIQMGVIVGRVIPTLVDEQEGKDALVGLSYTGRR
ncbi:MAG: DUF2846 domain-containing protein [Gammaproteobacteria bacterium]|nr:DUF2846 domain-containing protein [Gammaproteobacteria bacterium]NIM74406.1 DUF2846 domain-containing protein [Gammaproteobacteria bacterium]NIO26177.1 DUF2846 domain-containing protein [Gammaproteobacteria bacterium]NIO66791.1 DUF2846 domain-containing protein [Gammaproteobacteria bacterium]NIP65943.1 DUF2846 domain-containing protein [Gammaproteobacteria bacterium]